MHFIVNPHSCGGATGRYWKELEKLLKRELKSYSYDFTAHPGDAIELTQKALKKRPEIVVAVGGDGTVSEVINGYLANGAPPKGAPPIGIANSGTGADFCRSLGAPSDPSLSLQILKNGRDLSVDVGLLEAHSHEGLPLRRYFINTVSFGIAGEVSMAVNRSSKQHGAFSYFLSALGKNFVYRNKRVRISIDGGMPVERSITTAAICNGQFFGGGMQIAPKALLNDRRLQIVLIEDWGFLQAIRYSRRLYNGSIPFCKGVHIQPATSLRADPVSPGDKILIDSDGEALGILPLKAAIAPHSLTFRV